MVKGSQIQVEPWIVYGGGIALATALVISIAVMGSQIDEGQTASNSPPVPAEPVVERPEWVSWTALGGRMSGTSTPVLNAFESILRVADETFTESDWGYVRTRVVQNFVAQACEAGQGPSGYAVPELGSLCEQTYTLLGEWLEAKEISISQDQICTRIAIVQAATDNLVNAAKTERDLVESGSAYHAAITLNKAICSSDDEIAQAAARARGVRKVGTLPLESLPPQTGDLIENMAQSGQADAHRESLQALGDAISARIDMKNASTPAK